LALCQGEGPVEAKKRATRTISHIEPPIIDPPMDHHGTDFIIRQACQTFDMEAQGIAGPQDGRWPDGLTGFQTNDGGLAHPGCGSELTDREMLAHTNATESITDHHRT